MPDHSNIPIPDVPKWTDHLTTLLTSRPHKSKLKSDKQMAQIEYIDNLFKEYLVFRGFSNTLKTLDAEQKIERDSSFRAEKIADQLYNYINTHDLQSFKSLWAHLDGNLFTRLEHSHATAVKNLENGLLRAYIVTAHNNGRGDKVAEFFNKLASELQSQNEWMDWFCFPFVKTPEDLPSFSLYFSKQWQDTLQISLRNFLSTLYQCIPQPTFVRAEEEITLIRRLHEDNVALKTRVQALQGQIAGTFGSTQNLHSHTSSGDSVKRQLGKKLPQNLSDIISFDISPPGHIVDDFYIIASETVNISQAADTQTKGLKSLIKNIGYSSSPVMGRKENPDKTKKRSGSVGRSWM